ncbi:MAG TPA: DUF4173 domain-containing protein [Phototrophicaceae bacterium]|nr:DUF4173 domain-containing protein [Phototrophicaceae bacterium]
MDRKRFALYTVVIGAFVGVIGDLLFFGKAIGISFPLFLLILIVLVLASQGLMRQTIHPRQLWPLIPALFFGCMVAVRADAGINTLNVMAAFALCLLALHYMPGSRPIDLDATADHIFSTLEATFGTLLAPLFEVFDSIGWCVERLTGHGRVIMSVGRGLAITAPIVLIFGVLLASADAVFAGYADRIVSFLRFPQFSNEVILQIVMIGGIGWVACGALAYGVGRRMRAEDRAEKPKRKLPSLGLIEGCIALGSIDLLFGLFVIIQFAYFFDGRTTLAISGMTYADYARSGFFELVAVSVLTLAFVLALDAMTVRARQRHTRLFQVLSLILVALTGVILVSASQRMLLYEDQYGFTMLRVDTHVFMYWLAVLFIFFVLALFRVRRRVFSLGLLIVLIGYVGTLNLMNVQGYITERNIARAAEGREVDFYYLLQFSEDAEPAMLHMYQTTNSQTLRTASGQWLAHMLMQLDSLRAMGTDSTIFSANLARDSAWASLNAVRASLPTFDPSHYYYYAVVAASDDSQQQGSSYHGDDMTG